MYTSSEAAASVATGLLQENDPQFTNVPGSSNFPAVANVREVGNAETVVVGGVSILAIHTPGHTPGGVTWTWQSCALGTCYDIVYADSLSAVSAEGFQFGAGTAAVDLRASATIISGLDCDILLSPHPFFFGMHEKLERRNDGNPFINNVGCMIYAENSLVRLEERLRAESGRLPVSD